MKIVLHLCCSVMVLKKLGDELMPDFHAVVEYLGMEQGMQVVVEPHEHAKMVHRLSNTLVLVQCCLAHTCTASSKSKLPLLHRSNMARPWTEVLPVPATFRHNTTCRLILCYHLR